MLKAGKIKLISPALIFGDQAVSSLTNFLLTITVARITTPINFGFFAIGYSLMWLVIGISRSLIGEVDLLVAANDSRKHRISVGASILFGFVITACSAGYFLSYDYSPEKSFIFAFILTVPLVLAADAARYGSFARNMPQSALTIDLIWFFIVFVGFLLTFSCLKISATLVVLIWGAGAGVGLFVSAIIWRDARPIFSGIVAWASKRKGISLSFVTDFLATSGIGQLTILLLAEYAGVLTVGAYRGASVLLGPLGVIFSGTVVLITSKIKHELTFTKTNNSKTALIAVLSLLSASLLMGAVLPFLPGFIGLLLLGSTWKSAAALIPWLAVAFGFQAGSQVAVIILRLRKKVIKATSLRVLFSIIQGFCIIYFGITFGPLGAAIATLLTSILAFIAWWTIVFAPEIIKNQSSRKKKNKNSKAKYE